MKKPTGIRMIICFMLIGLLAAGCGGAKQTAAPGPSSGSQPVEPKQESVADLFAKGQKISGLSYDFVMTAKQEQPMTGKMWIAGKKMKSEILVENTKMMMIIDRDANVAYTYNPAENMAMKIPLNNQLKTTDTPDKFTKDVDVGKVKVLETTTYDGVKCRLLLVADETNKTQTKMWVREDYGIPMRVEVADPEGSRMVMEYKNMKIGDLPADVFHLPSGVTVTDMGEMMKKMSPKQ